MEKGVSRLKRIVSLCISLLLLGFLDTSSLAQAAARRAPDASDFAMPKNPRVLIIGSSVAAGWKDQKGGYLKRTFDKLSMTTGVHYHLISQAVPGQGAARLNPFYPQWLMEAHPQIVVLAWGILDDLYEHTPLPAFSEMIRQQISLALQRHAVVFLVTTPISKASYTQYQDLQPIYINTERQVAYSFRDPNVYVFNVFDQMKRYLAEHGQTYVPYMADGWHPNSRGHALASRILFRDIMHQFGRSPISFVMGPKSHLAE